MYTNSRFLMIRGCTIHYRVMQPVGRARHHALLLASPGQSTYNWRHLVPELLSAGTLCVLCDLPGFGLSEASEKVPFRQSVRAGCLWGMLDVLDQQYGGSLSTWHLLAHGSACGTIVEMALAQPDSVGSLFMLSPMLYSPLGKAFSPLLAGRVGRLLTDLWYRTNIANRVRFNRWVSHLYGCRLPANLLCQLRGPMMRLNQPPGALQRLLQQGYAVHTADAYKLFMPMMVLWGGRDRLLGGSIPERLRRDFPEAEYHLPPTSGHCAGETNHAAVCDFLRGWIREMWT